MDEVQFQLTPPPADASGRFAPSPTGRLHLGNLRTALLAWCCARSTGSRFSLRIEDLDRQRVREGAAEQQLAELAAIGIDWDGAVVRQSERTSLYADAIEKLRAAGLIYECWCTRAEIRQAASAPHGTVPRYPGSCRDLAAATTAQRSASGQLPALRARAEGTEVSFVDRIHGPVTGCLDDFVVRRQDGTAAYQLAVVVDDAEQAIGEVVRGDDLLDSTAAQCWLQQALELPRPSYVHLPLLLDQSGKRISKRDGAATLAGQAGAGRDAAQVRSDLAASVGLCEANEPVTAAELARRFAAILVRSPQ